MILKEMGRNRKKPEERGRNRKKQGGGKLEETGRNGKKNCTVFTVLTVYSVLTVLREGLKKKTANYPHLVDRGVGVLKCLYNKIFSFIFVSYWFILLLPKFVFL